VISAIFGARLVLRMSDRRLTILMATLLTALGLLLLVEAFVPFGNAALIASQRSSAASRASYSVLASVS